MQYSRLLSENQAGFNFLLWEIVVEYIPLDLPRGIHTGVDSCRTLPQLIAGQFFIITLGTSIWISMQSSSEPEVGSCIATTMFRQYF